MAVLRKRGKIWYVDYRLAGKRYRKAIGRSKEFAVITLLDIQNRLNKIKEGLLPEEEIAGRNIDVASLDKDLWQKTYP